jgi:arginase
MNVQVFEVPYDSGRRGERMGAGPGRLLQNGLEDFLRTRGHAVQIEEIEAQAGFQTEIGTSFALYRSLAGQVRASCEQGRFPLVLSGNCGAALGSLAGLAALGERPLGIAWFDAHGDFNTPDTSTSGFLDGMGLATAAGLGWKSLALTIPGFRPISPTNILHIGGRDFDRPEEALLREQHVGLVSGPAVREKGIRAALAPQLEAICTRVQDVYVHLDLDVLDPVEAPANLFPVPGGLTVDEAVAALGLLRERLRIAGVGVASYDPSYDPEGKALWAAFRLIEAVVG